MFGEIPLDGYRGIFVYNICLVSISDTVSDGATKTEVLNIKKAQHYYLSPRDLSPMYCILFARRRFKSSALYKQCMSLLALSPPINFAVFESQFLRILHSKSQRSHQLLSFTSSLNFCSQFVSSVTPSMGKIVC